MKVMERIVVIGVSCSGRTTLAAQLARILDFAHIELDQLHWLENWQMCPTPVFRARVADAIAPSQWVLDGNYSKVRDLVWPRATDIIWLNYDFRVVFSRALRRMFRRALVRQELFAWNRETLAQVILNRESILWWVIRTYHRRRREYPRLFSQEAYAHLHVHELKHPQEADQLVERLSANGSA